MVRERYVCSYTAPAVYLTDLTASSTTTRNACTSTKKSVCFLSNSISTYILLYSYEGQLEQLQQQTFNMEQAQMTTENLTGTMATVDAMQTANKQMRKQYGKIDIDKIDSIQDDMQDLIESATEIQETLGRSYGVPDEIDEADLEAGMSCLLCSFLANRNYAELDALGDDLNEIDETPSYLQNPDSNPPETIPELLETPVS